jgi:hypothetical protein
MLAFEYGSYISESFLELRVQPKIVPHRSRTRSSRSPSSRRSPRGAQTTTQPSWWSRLPSSNNSSLTVVAHRGRRGTSQLCSFRRVQYHIPIPS